MHPPSRYADLLRQQFDQHGSAVWLVNARWNVGPYSVGKRMHIVSRRAMVTAVLDGILRQVPTTCPGVPAELPQHRRT